MMSEFAGHYGTTISFLNTPAEKIRRARDNITHSYCAWSDAILPGSIALRSRQAAEVDTGRGGDCRRGGG